MQNKALGMHWIYSHVWKAQCCNPDPICHPIPIWEYAYFMPVLLQGHLRVLLIPGPRQGSTDWRLSLPNNLFIPEQSRKNSRAVIGEVSSKCLPIWGFTFLCSTLPQSVLATMHVPPRVCSSKIPPIQGSTHKSVCSPTRCSHHNFFPSKDVLFQKSTYAGVNWDLQKSVHPKQSLLIRVPPPRMCSSKSLNTKACSCLSMRAFLLCSLNSDPPLRVYTS